MHLLKFTIHLLGGLTQIYYAFTSIFFSQADVADTLRLMNLAVRQEN